MEYHPVASYQVCRLCSRLFLSRQPQGYYEIASHVMLLMQSKHLSPSNGQQSLRRFGFPLCFDLIFLSLWLTPLPTCSSIRCSSNTASKLSPPGLCYWFCPGHPSSDNFMACTLLPADLHCNLIFSVGTSLVTLFKVILSDPPHSFAALV